MSTNSSSAFASTLLPSLLRQDQVAKLKVVFNFAIIPCLSAVGICGNVLSMFLLTRHGFRKPSNILLLALSVADVLFLAGINNFSRYVQSANIPVGYSFSEIVNYTFYVCYMLLFSARYFGMCCSVLIPVLITGERLLVVFLPLKVHTIVTPLRTLLVVVCVSVLIISCFIYQYGLCYRFEQVLVNGALLGRSVPTKRFYQDVRSGVYVLLADIINYITGIVPMVLVTLGCSIIGLKITLIASKRRQLTSVKYTSKNKPVPLKTLTKSTRTLLYICVLYILCSSIGFIIVYVERIQSISANIPLLIILDSINTLSQCINSVGNFIIYVAANNNFKYIDLKACFVKIRRRDG